MQVIDDRLATHQPENLVPILPDINLFSCDLALAEAVRRHAPGAAPEGLVAWGERLGQASLAALAAEVNRDGPRLQTHDRRGARVDTVHFAAGWHRFLSLAFAEGLHGAPWLHPGPGQHVLRAARFLMHGQVESGSLCPVTMTSAAIPLLAREPWFEALRAPLASADYDARDLPIARKGSMMVGMGLTEKQGGSDLRSNTSRACALAGESDWFRLVGHKWFFSSPMSDAHLMLARDAEGLSCFYVPRWLDDGQRNPVHIQRLKDKVGNRSNASVEVEFNGALGRRIGTPGRGIAMLVEMASHTRLDCVLGSTALLRAALVQALHHARHRRAFGRFLADQPLMQQVLADQVLESEAATALAIRLASAVDAAHDPGEAVFLRLLTPAAKFWVCKRTIAAVAECMEVWGGNGYIEDGPMARFYREAPVNSIWEGSGNVMCLDVLRGLGRHPEAAADLIRRLGQPHAQAPAVKALCARLERAIAQADSMREVAARAIARDLVLLVQADLLLRHAPAVVSRSFVATRLPSPGHDAIDDRSVAPDDAVRLLARAWPE